MSTRAVVYKGSWPGRWSDLLPPFSTGRELPLETTEELKEVHAFVNRAFPSCLVLEGASDTEEALALCTDLKKDPFTAVVPIVVPVLADQTDRISDWLAAGADEVVSGSKRNSLYDTRIWTTSRSSTTDTGTTTEIM